MSAARRGTTRPVLGFIGIHSGGRSDQAVSQNETVAGLFSQSGYRVRRASAVRNRTRDSAAS